jgi:decaprenylphospho-beta-D-ribofuranose 2-oxidase
MRPVAHQGVMGTVATVTLELLSGWGGAGGSVAGVHRFHPQTAVNASVSHLLGQVGDRGLVARGAGRSYGDAATNGGGDVIVLPRSTAAVDPTSGVARVRAGAWLEDLLVSGFQHGLIPPVMPGTRHITVGGAVAADVHGKNHHRDGSFGSWVQAMTVIDGTGAVRRLHREGPDSHLFWATVGGMGLTGVIVDVDVQLQPVGSSWLVADTIRGNDLDEVMSTMREADRSHPYTVAWVDLASTGAHLGRGVVSCGRFAERDELAPRHRGNPMAYTPTQRVSVPAPVARFGPGFVNPATVRAFNEAWWQKTPRRRTGQLQRFSAFFHPLDGVGDWPRLYGTGGFVQYQFVVPDGAEAVVHEVARDLIAHQAGTPMVVLKRFGPSNRAPLGFCAPGWTLAVDLPARTEGLSRLLQRFDRFVADAGGRVYLAKDSRLEPEMLREMYPRLGEWEEAQAELDPDGCFVSDLSRRLKLGVGGRR